MTILTLDWNKGAPDAFAAGMVVRFKSGKTSLIGEFDQYISMGPRSDGFYEAALSNISEWAWLVKPHELDWIGSIRKQHVKGRPE